MDSTSLGAAHIELVALRAFLPKSARVERNRVRLPPDPTLLDDQQAMVALARLPKPAHCVPEVVDRALSIKVEGLAPDVVSWHTRVAPQQVQFWMANVALREEARNVLFEGEGETITVSTEA